MFQLSNGALWKGESWKGDAIGNDRFEVISRSRPPHRSPANMPTPARPGFQPDVFQLADSRPLLPADPGNGEVVGSLPEMGLKETKAAIQIAYDTFNGPWRDTSEYERAAMLNKLFKSVVTLFTPRGRLMSRAFGIEWLTKAVADLRRACRLMQDNAEDFAQVSSSPTFARPPLTLAAC